ncbi:MAG TPA: PAS domain S-box protein [Actinobacteria bacterium]|nr:virulence sensor protein BvgS precursor [bacterium BMS3Bbin01]HDH26609.1 PAS domain S-box protein [Actinomycetota bacterium]
MNVWPTVEDLHRRYVHAGAYVAAVLGAAYGVAAGVRSDVSLAVSSLILFFFAALALWQLRYGHPRLDVLLGLAGLLLIGAALVNEPVILMSALLTYTVFAAATAYLGGRWLSLWFGAAILITAVVFILRLRASPALTVLAIGILLIGSGIGGLLYRETGSLIRSEAARWDALFSLAPNGIVVVDTDGNIVMVNDRFVEMFGLESRSDVLGGTLDRFIPERFRHKHPKLVRDFAVSEEHQRRMEKRPLLHGVRANGEEFRIEISIANVSFDGQQALMAIVRDVTERLENLRRLEEMAESRLQLLASVSHEVRTPLTAILGFAELLKEDTGLSSEERDAMMKDIASEASDMANLVEDLLVGAQAELGELEVIQVPVNLEDQVRHVLESLRVTAPVEVKGNVVGNTDPGRVRQILRNLVTNAQRYGGADLRIEIGRHDETITIAVSDNGPPLPEDDQERIFERFHVAQPQQGKPGPIGIGLPLSRDLARRMGGDLTYRHAGGRTIFELTVPAYG